MPETKIQGKFYPLKNSGWVDCCKQLTKSQLSVLYYLRLLDPYSNGIKVRASKIGDELGISKRAVNAAIAVLAEIGTKAQMSRLADIEAACLAFGVAVTGCEAEPC